MNHREVVGGAITGWASANPRERGERIRDYRVRMRRGVAARLEEEYPVGSPILMILLQLLPLLVEWFLNRRS